MRFFAQRGLDEADQFLQRGSPGFAEVENLKSLTLVAGLENAIENILDVRVIARRRTIAKDLNPCPCRRPFHPSPASAQRDTIR